MLIDSHCHLDDYTDLSAILANASSADVREVVAIGIGNGPHEMHVAVDIAHKHPNVWATVGVHPQEAHQVDVESLAILATLAADPKVIAIGEIGLDYYHAENPDVDVQQRAFVDQMHIAIRAQKPITIHVRTSELAQPNARARFESHGNPHAAWDDLLRLLHESWKPAGLPGIMHCFSGNADQARAALDLGFYLSFAGNVTYTKSAIIQDVARWAPADRILVETDAPFLTPVPMRGKTPQNEPAHTAHTARFLAELRNTTPEAIAEQTTANFRTLFPTTAAS
ncbi:MAG: TatD family hydrolase [Acidobacteriaceae bacterium]|nr:TatD family hydrolase [Acidobacteriaceae bacterium]